MRILIAVVALGAATLFSSCTTLQRYPSFGTVEGGRFIYYDRSGIRNVLPPANHNAGAHPAPVAPVSPVH